MLYLLAVLTSIGVFGNGCEECDLDDPPVRCQNNKVVVCTPFEYGGMLSEVIDCNDFNTTCKKIELSPYVEMNVHEADLEPTSHGCVLPNSNCSDSDPTREYCSENGNYYTACTVDAPRKQVIVGVKAQYDGPFCVESDKGEAGFSFIDEPCSVGESTCSAENEITGCSSKGIWERYEIVRCTRVEYDICEETVDSEGQRTATCVERIPSAECNESTGSVDLCDDATWFYSDAFYFHCGNAGGDAGGDSNEGGWRWELQRCMDPQVCVQDTPSTIICGSTVERARSEYPQ